MVLDELRDKGFPAYGQEEAGGAVFAMPLTPTPGPGVTWIVRVPEPAVDDAKQIIDSLPVDSKQLPDVWHFGPTPFGRKVFRVWAFIALFIIAVWLLFEVFKYV
jgi:hypothetical protein